MDLAPGKTLGQYRLIEKIGEGGMGVVWRALDTSLDREVAVKILPDLFAGDPNRLARFEREAKLLASLNHPGIATIHGLHEASGIHFLAMELVPGVDLARRLAEGPTPIDEALGIALKVADSLEAAHESGIIHRDLKPANIQIAPDGKVKILDFGLGKALEPEASAGRGATLSPTLTTPASTRAGVILGTAAYMSPEQAKGKPVDRRADIWAFGCVLFEMLAGRRPFEGDGVSEVLAAVIMSPVELRGLPPAVPSRVRLLVRRCLEKDPRRRLRDIGEARHVLEETLAGVGEETGAVQAPAEGRRGWKGGAAIAGAALLSAMATAGAIFFLAPAPRTAPVRRFEIPAHGPFRSALQGRLVALSPDGRSIATVEEGKLLLRRLSQLETTAIPTASEPGFVFWSPDSAWIGFAAGGKLWKAPGSGGQALLIADIHANMTGGAGATWCPDGHIVLSRGDGDLLRVAALGGDFETFVKVDAKQEGDLHDPECLPDNSVVFASHTLGGRPDTLYLFADGQRKEIMKIPGQDFWFPVYSPTGHLLYRRQTANAGVWAVPFSLRRHETTGEPFMVAPDADVPSVSADGTLVHVRGAASRLTQLVWADRSGLVLGKIGPPQEQWPFPALSPDSHRVAIYARENEVDDIWIHDTERGTRTRLSAGSRPFAIPTWSSDGRQILYSAGSLPFEMKMKAADGGGEAIPLGAGWSAAFSFDGHAILFAAKHDPDELDLFRMDLAKGGPAEVLVQQTSDQTWPSPSPDGRYFAYVSGESGPDEVYIKRYPGGEGKWQVSNSGGTWPHWGRGGKHLYYVHEDTLMEVDVAGGPDLKLGTPKALFTRKPLGWSLPFGWPASFDVTAAEDRFVLVEPVGDKPDPGGIVVLENWIGEFARPGS